MIVIDNESAVNIKSCGSSNIKKLRSQNLQICVGSLQHKKKLQTRFSVQQSLAVGTPILYLDQGLFVRSHFHQFRWSMWAENLDWIQLALYPHLGLSCDLALAAKSHPLHKIVSGEHKIVSCNIKTTAAWVDLKNRVGSEHKIISCNIKKTSAGSSSKKWSRHLT